MKRLIPYWPLVALALLAGAGGWIYHQGKVSERQAIELAAVKSEIASRDALILRTVHERDAAAHAAVTATERSDSTRKLYAATRMKVTMKGDTAIVDGDSVAHVLPGSVVELIRASDVHIAALEAETGALKREIAVDAALIEAQQAQLAAKDREIATLEKMKAPRCGAVCGALLGAATVIGAVIAF
jgi:hypothetical protein